MNSISRRSLLAAPAAFAFGAPALAQGNEPILIGAHLDVAKQASYYSLLQKDAIEAYLKLKNSHGGVKGRPIRVLYEDDELNPTIATQKVEKLASQGVIAILSISGSTTGLAAQAKTEELKIPTLSGNTAEKLMTVPPKRYYFRMALRDSLAGQAIADFIRSRNATAKVAVVRDATETGLLVSDAYIQSLKVAGLNVAAVEQITPGSAEVTAQALNVRRSGAEYVLLAGASVPDLANYLKTHKQLGNKAQTLGSFVLSAPSFLGLVGEAGNGFIFPDTVDFSRPEVTAIVNNLAPILGDKAKGFSAPVQSWEMMRLLADAIERGGATREGLRSAMEGTRNLQTAVGTAGTAVTFSPDVHDAFSQPKQVVMRQIWNKAYRTYQ